MSLPFVDFAVLDLDSQEKRESGKTSVAAQTKEEEEEKIVGILLVSRPTAQVADILNSPAQGPLPLPSTPLARRLRVSPS